MPSSERVIPIADLRAQALLRPIGVDANALSASSGKLVDTLGRPLRDLRISVTDRCNFRCSYCMPREVFDKDYPYLPHSSLLTFEEIARLARVFVSQGVRKIRLTGGEPLLRKNIERLVEQLASIRTPDGDALDLTLTTNGSLLARKAQSLRDAGLKRVTVSLDGLDDAVFRKMNDADFPVADVLEGIEAAKAAGLGPIKVNMVVKRGTNDQEIIPMARHFKGTGVILRFIEYMDVGSTNGWRMNDVMPSSEVRAMIDEAMPLNNIQASQEGETAGRWAYADGTGEVGFISSVTDAFCGDCNRARLSTEGQLYLCLFATSGYDLRSLVRPVDGLADDMQIAAAIRGIWQGRDDQYSQLRASGDSRDAGDSSQPTSGNDGGRRVEMSYIGG